jgi:hypothetical protein
MKWVVVSIAVLLAGVSVAEARGGGAIIVPMYAPVARYEPDTDVGDYSQIRSVAIVSLIGRALNIRRFGLVTTDTQSVAIGDWHLDELVTSELQQALAGRFTVKEPDAIPNALPDAPPDNSWSSLQTYLSSRNATGIDAFVVVRPHSDPVLYLNRPPNGLVLMNTGDLYHTDPYSERAYYEIDIIDAHTLKKIASADSRIGRDGEPVVLVGDDMTPGDDPVFTSLQRANLQSDFRRLVGASLPPTLRALELGVEISPTGAAVQVDLSKPGAPVQVDLSKPEGQASSRKTLAIVSAIGDQLDFEETTPFGIGASGDVLPLRDWTLDTEIEGQVRAAVGDGFAIKDVASNRAALASARLVDRDGRWKETLEALAPSPEVDDYLVIVKNPKPIHGVYRNGTGIGLWNRATLAGETSVYAHFAVALVDARTLRIMAARDGTVGLRPGLTGDEPILDVDSSLWAGSPDRATPSQLRAIRAEIDALLAQSIPETVSRVLSTAGTAASADRGN